VYRKKPHIVVDGFSEEKKKESSYSISYYENSLEGVVQSRMDIMFFSFFLSFSFQAIHKERTQKPFCSTFIIFRHSYSAHIKKGRYLYSTLLLRHYTLRKRRKLFSSFYLFFRYYSKVAGRSVGRPRPEYKCAIPDLYYTQLLAFRKCGCC
jgi:hypothetical protein